MILTRDELAQRIESARTSLLEANTRFSYNRNSFLSFPNSSGVYAVYLFEELIYIGETADLKERMKDMKNTYNHTLRRKLGFHLFETAEITVRKFSNEIENRLNLIFQHAITISYIEVNFGRTEIENHLIKENQNLLNSISLRGN